ncbi:glycosyltransferase family 4 protein [Brevibacillus daliensis]|uniref:glycosyltransferase family 4 protein n=1 Tax=Brevibacillus daliensis TaxID=2892995 RepID=UPI001E5C781D|nr:glycosyltransferase family 4 protein [Brevibacillus daliensis]
MKSKLRVLHIIGGGEFGGAEQHILNLLTSFSKEKVEVAVVCFYDALFARKLREAGITVTTLHTYGRFDMRILQGVKHEIEKMDPDIVHTHGVKANFLGRLAVRNLQYRTITTVHSNLRYDYVSPFASFVTTQMEKRTRKWNDHFITVSRALQDVLIQEDGIPASKTTVIYNGTDLTPYQLHMEKEVDRKALREEWNLPQDAFVFGNVGRIVQIKGLPHLLDAFSLYLKKTNATNSYLVIIGDGPERSSLEEQANRLGITSFIRFVGFRTDVPRCLHAIDLYVHAALYEGLGYTIVEAMASHLPVIATSAGGVPEFVLSQETGLLVTPASPEELTEAMITLEADTDLQQKLVEQASDMVEQRFTIDKMAELTLDLYHRLVAKSAR